MSDTKQVLATGDLVIDHYLAKEKQSPKSYVEVLQQNVSHTVSGGAWFLTQLVELACNSLDKTTIVGPPQSQESLAAQAHSVWADVPRSAQQPKVLVSRIVDFLGCSSPQERPTATTAVSAANTGITPDLLVIEDLHLGFDNAKSRWPNALRNGTPPGAIILKANAPPRDSQLWKHLLERHADRLTVVISINSLRARGAAVSKGLSWDQTIEDLSREFESGPSAYDLARCKQTIVYFPDGSAAASFTRCPFKLGPLNNGESPDAPVRPVAAFEKFLYLPNEVEGAFLDARQGKLFGMGSVVTAALARHMLAPETYPQYIALGRALSAGRHIFDVGGLGKESRTSIDVQGIRDRLLFVTPEKNAPPNAIKVDPAFAYCTAYPHEVFDDARMQQQPATKSDLLRDVAGPTAEYMKAKAFEVVMEGAAHALSAVPKASYGKYQTVDREEIERINAVRALIDEYRNNSEDKRPLSIAVFGQPGSGKSFAIKQLGESLFGEKNPTLEFNLSQFADDALHQLHQAFHRVRDASIKGAIPLVFWDEFDADDLTWLKHFLAPMQDAEFRVGSDVHVFGKAIFVFAGGTKTSFADFDRSHSGTPEEQKFFRERKGPDFISRLRGQIDIKGPNPAHDKPDEDPAYVIRRALILRSSLELMYKHLIDEPTKRAHIDAAIVYGFLNADKFLHGARSIQSLLAMCRLHGASWFDVSRLNTPNLLKMHVTENFITQVRQSAFDAELIEAISEAIHDGWVELRRRIGWKYGDTRDDVAKTDPALKWYLELTDKDKEPNRTAARVMPAKLADVGYELVRQLPGSVIVTEPLPEDVCAKLARHEHDRWLRERLIQGFAYAPTTNKHLRQHRDVAPFDQLGDDEKQLDFVIAEKLPPLLAARHISLRP